jgi:hypothetical protein
MGSGHGGVQGLGEFDLVEGVGAGGPGRVHDDVGDAVGAAVAVPEAAVGKEGRVGDGVEDERVGLVDHEAFGVGVLFLGYPAALLGEGGEGERESNPGESTCRPTVGPREAQ